MKRILFISLLLLVFAFSLFANVTYNDLGNGKYSVTLTYNDDVANQIYMIGSWQSWSEPGIPMTKNAEGVWEITIPMDKSKILYKFYNPELEGDKYVEDPEAKEAVANPFGTKDAVLRKPRPKTTDGTVAEIDEWNPLFSIYSRNYFYQRVVSNMSMNTRTNNYAIKLQDSTADPHPDADVMWNGEFGTTDGDFARIRYSQGYMFFNNTVKFHGNVLKHFTIDVEVNAQGRYDWDFATYWDASGDAAREAKLTELARVNGSAIADMFFGALTTTNFDQLVFGWTTKHFDAYLGAKNCKNINSKDPMMLVNGSKVGDKDSGAHNVEVLIHPDAVKGLNVNLGVSKSSPSTRKYMAYLDASYNILKESKYTIGAIYYMTSYSPSALDAFTNSIHALSLWATLKPVKGLTIAAQGVVQLPTRYWNQYSRGGVLYDVTADDVNDFAADRVASTGYDFFANSAAYLKVGYVHKIFNISYQLAAGGSQFAGDLSKKGTMFSEEADIATDIRVTGEQDFLDMALPYKNLYHSSNGAQIRNDLAFNITPIPEKKDLLKISFKDRLVIGKLEGLTASSEEAYSLTNTGGYQADRFQIDNVFNVGLQTKFKVNTVEMMFEAHAVFSLTIYQSNALAGGTVLKPGTFFTFNQAELNVEIKNISKVFKSIGIQYFFGMDYYPGYYQTSEFLYDKAKMGKIQWKKMFNQVVINTKWSNKIELNLGFIARLFHGSGENTSGDRWTFDGDAGYEKVETYFNFGLALGFKYVIPVEILKEPMLYVNFSMGWDPFTDAKFGEEYEKLQTNQWETGLGADATVGEQNNFAEEHSLLTIGLKWDF